MEKQRSETNLQRRVDGFSRDGCFVWYSSKTRANGRASVMVYAVVQDGVEAWFAAFKRGQSWRLQATKGASRDDVEKLLTTGAELPLF